MGVRIESTEISYKEEATAQLQRIDGEKLGRGYSTGYNTSLPFEHEVRDANLNERVQHAIKREQERFPDNPDVFSDEFVVGLTLGIWVAIHELELRGVDTSRKPHI